MSQSTEKSLGEVAFRADDYDGGPLVWDSLTIQKIRAYERMAQAVAEIVREQCAQACEQERLPTQPPEHPGDEAYERAITDCVKAIRRAKRGRWSCTTRCACFGVAMGDSSLSKTWTNC